jgi:hypothetical protein
MAPKLFSAIIVLSICLCCLRTMAQQQDSIPARTDTMTLEEDMFPYQVDPVPPADQEPGTRSGFRLPPNAPGREYPSKKSSFYYVVTALSGVGVLHSPSNGQLNVSFPYTVDGTDSVFHSGNIGPYASSKVFILPFGFEIGNLRQFMDANFAFSVIGKWTRGFNLSLGYGRNFYLGGHRDPTAGKGLVVKPSISLVYTKDNGYNSDALFGSIDNTDKTITVFDKVANPTFDETSTTTDDQGNSTTTTTTYNANSLNVAYVQREFAFMPRLTISNNQYRKGPHLELTIGYNISVASLIDLGHEGVTATYNGRQITSAPFSFSGLYLGLTVNFVGH